MKNLKFSVITVVYNRVETIERTIKSILKQSYNNIEYIIIDGGSSDGTIEVIKKYEHRIAAWISEPDKGIYDAMNKGVLLSTGDVISFLNSDDWYEADALEYAAKQFDNKDIDILFANIAEVSSNKIRQARPITSDSVKSMYLQMSVYHPSTFAKRNLFVKHGLFNIDYKIASDYDWILRVLKADPDYTCSDKVTTYYSTTGISSTCGRETYEESKKIAFDHATEEQQKNEIIQFYGKQDKFWRYKEMLEAGTELPAFEWMPDFISKRNIYVFGLGQVGEECHKLLQRAKISIAGFVDNNQEIWGDIYRGLPVLAPKVLGIENDFVIIASTRYEEEIEQQLENMGFKQNDGFILYSEIRELVAERLNDLK